MTNGVGHISVTGNHCVLSAACLEGAGEPSRCPGARLGGGEAAAAPVVRSTVGSRVGAAAVKAPSRRSAGPAPCPARPILSPGLAAALLALLGIGLLAGGAPCSRPRYCGRGWIGVVSLTPTSAGVPSGSCATRRRGTPATVGGRQAWPRGSSASRSWLGLPRASRGRGLTPGLPTQRRSPTVSSIRRRTA